MKKSKSHIPTGKPPTGNQSDMVWNEERAGSMDRALYMGSILFRLENYKPIMMALHNLRFGKPSEQEAAPGDFRAACETAGLEEEEIDWIWRYLQHYGENVNWALDDGW